MIIKYTNQFSVTPASEIPRGFQHTRREPIKGKFKSEFQRMLEKERQLDKDKKER